MSGFGQAMGVVAGFDDERGLGTVQTDDGRMLPFHCTKIAGGARTIPVGTRVRVEVVAGLPGRWEAAAVTPVEA